MNERTLEEFLWPKLKFAVECLLLLLRVWDGTSRNFGRVIMRSELL